MTTRSTPIPVSLWVKVWIALDFVIGLAVGGFGIATYRIAEATHRVQVTQYEACLSANNAKLTNLEAFENVLALVPNVSKDQRVFHTQVNTILSKQYQPTACSKIVH